MPVLFGNYYSKDDFFANNIIANASKGKMPMLGNGDFYVNWIHIEDAADAIVFAVLIEYINHPTPSP